MKITYPKRYYIDGEYAELYDRLKRIIDSCIVEYQKKHSYPLNIFFTNSIVKRCCGQILYQLKEFNSKKTSESKEGEDGNFKRKNICKG